MLTNELAISVGERRAVLAQRSVMKYVAISLLIFSLLSSCAALRPPISARSDGGRQQLGRRRAIAGLAATCCLGLAPTSAQAAEAVPKLAGTYSDPNHPRGYREFVLTGAGKAVVKGKDEPTDAGWELQALVDGPKVTLLLVDGPVRPEAYDPTSVNIESVDETLQRTFVGTFTTDGKVGISWADGNFWTREK